MAERTTTTPPHTTTIVTSDAISASTFKSVAFASAYIVPKPRGPVLTLQRSRNGAATLFKGLRPSTETGAVIGTSTRQSSPPQRIIQLDMLRGVAILMVLFCHEVIVVAKSGWLQPVMSPLVGFGWSGVDLFFVLSGYLIGGLLFKEISRTGSFDPKRFIVRRGFKIFPPYVAYIGIVFLVTWFDGDLSLHHARKVIVTLLPNIFHLQNYLGSIRFHTWSLSVEEHFYLLLPLLLIGLVRISKIQWIPWIAIGIAVLCTTWRYAFNAHLPMPLPLYKTGTPTHLRIDGLMWGVMLAYLAVYRGEWMAKVARYRGAIFLLGLLFIAPLALKLDLGYGFGWTFGYTTLYLGYGCILVAIMAVSGNSTTSRRVLSSRPARLLAFIGTASYGIYLIHWDASLLPMTALAKAGFMSGVPRTVRYAVVEIIYITLAVAAGWLLTRAVEKPSLALREKLFPPRIAR